MPPNRTRVSARVVARRLPLIWSEANSGGPNSEPKMLTISPGATPPPT